MSHENQIFLLEMTFVNLNAKHNVLRLTVML